MKDYIRKWNAMRIMRLIIGMVVIVQGIQGEQWILVGLGTVFSLMPIFNVGCGIGGCNVPQQRSRVHPDDEVVYEEVKLDSKLK